MPAQVVADALEIGLEVFQKTRPALAPGTDAVHQKYRWPFAFHGIGALDSLGWRGVAAQAPGDAPILLLDILKDDMDALRPTTASGDEGIGHSLGESALLFAGAAGKQFHSNDGHWHSSGYYPYALAGARKWGITSSANRCIISSVSPALWPYPQGARTSSMPSSAYTDSRSMSSVLVQMSRFSASSSSDCLRGNGSIMPARTMPGPLMLSKRL